MAWSLIVLGICAFIGWTARCLQAQQLPVRCYDTSEGLTHGSVRVIYQDSKGYVWIGTWDGLNRFDGMRFISYHEADGLGHRVINDIVEDRQGRLWVATNGGGVARLDEEEAMAGNPKRERAPQAVTPTSAARSQRSFLSAGGRKKFVSYRLPGPADANNVNRVLFDDQGRLWCATDAGLYRGLISPTGDVAFEVVVPLTHGDFRAAFADSRGHLWFGGFADRLVQVVRDQIITHPLPRGSSAEIVAGILEDRTGKLLIVGESGRLLEFTPSTDFSQDVSWRAKSARRGHWRRLPPALAPDQRVNVLLADFAGALWIGTTKGLIRYSDAHVMLHTTANGLSHDEVTALGRDREGGLWIGTQSGLCRLSSQAIIRITKAEGLPDPYVWRIVESRDGRIYVSTSSGIAEIVRGRARRVSGSPAHPLDQALGRVLQDRRGDWWIGTHRALFRFRGPELQRHRGRKFARELGLPEYGIAYEQGIYEDSRGHLWISTWNGVVGPRLFRFDPATERFHMLDVSSSWPTEAVLKMMEDRSGTLWLATTGGLGKVVNGRVIVMEPTEGLPEVRARALFEDRRGWIWIGLRYRGVSMTKNPQAERPTFVNYSTREGLSSDSVSCITEDDEGKIYLGTSRGLNQLDPVTGRIRHLRAWDGLAGDAITDCLKDRHGNIWIATTSGVSRYDPRAERSAPPAPPIYLTRVQVAGEDLIVPERGAQWLPERRFRAGQNTIRIEYVAVSLQAGRALRYQYKLEGADAHWSAPTEEHSVTYARLEPGSYRFLVRAVDGQGIALSEPAVFSFVILPPVWQRGWFIALMILLGSVVVYLVHRYRVVRLLELERMRTRLAADLHDDIGASLSEIALLSEIVKEHKFLTEASARQMLTEIADKARDLVDTMSDIVWAIDPRRDDVRSLILRIRQMAADILGAKGIACEIRASEAVEATRLSPDQRRHLYLILKEAIINIARHANCTQASLTISVENRRLIAEISDNGCGFDSAALTSGHGLENMRRRAAELKGRLDIATAPGQGTRLTLIVPLG
ncbi:MAG: histidine kinase [Blastocatellia bacterium]|nr:histidine kinase [Blastocatellia bacterium]